MGNLNQVIKLHAFADVGASHCRAVDTCVGANLYIILDGDDAYLWNLVVALWGGGETETVGADDATCMERYPRAQTTIVIDNSIGIENAVVANGNLFAHNGMRINLATFAHLGTFADIGKSTHIATFAHLCRRSDECQRVDALLLGLHRVVGLQKARHGFVGAFHTNERSLHLVFKCETLVDEYHR